MPTFPSILADLVILSFLLLANNVVHVEKSLYARWRIGFAMPPDYRPIANINLHVRNDRA